VLGARALGGVFVAEWYAQAADESAQCEAFLAEFPQRRVQSRAVLAVQHRPILGDHRGEVVADVGDSAGFLEEELFVFVQLEGSEYAGPQPPPGGSEVGWWPWNTHALSLSLGVCAIAYADGAQGDAGRQAGQAIFPGLPALPSEMAEEEWSRVSEQLVVRMGGGWGDAAYGQMSPGLRLRCLQEDARYEAQAAAVERDREVRRAAWEEANVLASIELAQQRAMVTGEFIDPRRAYQDGGVGRTVREAVEYFSLLQDVEDQQVEAATRAAQRRLNEQFYGEGVSWADTSAPTEAEVEASAAESARSDQQLLERGRTVRGRRARQAARKEIHKIAASEVRLAQMRQQDRTRERGWDS